MHIDPSTEAPGRGAGHVGKHLEPLSLVCMIPRKPAGWQVRRHEFRFRNQDPGSHSIAVGCDQPSPAESTGVDVTGKVFPRRSPGTELTKVESNRTESRERDSMVSQGPGHGHEHGDQGWPTWEGRLQEGSVSGRPCVEDADPGSRVGKSIRLMCGAFLHPGARLPESRSGPF